LPLRATRERYRRLHKVKRWHDRAAPIRAAANQRCDHCLVAMTGNCRGKVGSKETIGDASIPNGIGFLPQPPQHSRIGYDCIQELVRRSCGL
jgi:hypothetical protein